MNVLIVDPASSTGYCIYEFDDSSGEANIIYWDFIDVQTDSDYDGDRYVEIADHYRNIIEANDIEIVGIEDYFFSKKSSQGSTLNCAYRAICHMICREKSIHYDIINISNWKKFVNGRVRPTKEQKSKWGKEPAKKLMTQESLWNKWKIKFPNHSKSKKTDKPIKFRYDIVDAVGMAIYHASIYMNAKSISYNVGVQENHNWKNVPKGTFVYEDEEE